MTHQEIEHQEIIERYVRNELSSADRTAFQEHFFACDECFGRVQMTERFIAGVGHSAEAGVLNSTPAATSLLPRARRWLADEFGTGDWLGGSILKPAVAFVLMAVLVAGAIFYFRSRGRAPKQTLAKDNAPAVSQPRNNVAGQQNDHAPLQANQQNNAPPIGRETGTPEPVIAHAPGKATNGKRPSALSNRTTNETNSNQNQSGVAESDATRSVNSGSAGAKLSEVKRVFVEALGDQPANSEVRRLLIRQLRSSNRFAVAQSKDDADAVLKFSALPGRETNIIVRLVNANGFVIWPVDSTGSGRKYIGRADESATRVVNDILSEIRKTNPKN